MGPTTKTYKKVSAKASSVLRGFLVEYLYAYAMPVHILSP